MSYELRVIGNFLIPAKSFITRILNIHIKSTVTILRTRNS